MNKPVEEQLIEVCLPHDDEWHLAEVASLLSEQFTAVLWDGSLLFFFYKDEGVSWRTLEVPPEPDCEQLELPLES